MNEEQADAHLRKFIDSQKNQRAFAAMAGVSPGFLSDVLNGKRKPSAEMWKAAGLEPVVTYRKVKA